MIKCYLSACSCVVYWFIFTLNVASQLIIKIKGKCFLFFISVLDFLTEYGDLNKCLTTVKITS